MSAPSGEAATSRFERIAPVAIGATVLVPTLVAFYLPMSDLPLHEAIVGAMRHFYDPTFIPQGLYEWNLGHPNQLFHVAATLLSLVVSTRWAVKLVVAIAQLMIFVGGARFADHIGRSRWGIVLLAPLALGFTYFWGLVANLLGFAAFLLALPVIDRYAERPTWRGFAIVVVTFAALFFAHESVYVLVAGVLFFLALLRAGSIRAVAVRAAPVALAAAWALIHLAWQASKFSVASIQPPMRFFSLWKKLISLPNVLFGSHDDLPLYVLFALACLGVLTLLVQRARDPAPAPLAGHGVARVKAFGLRYRFELLAAMFLVIFFVAPFTWKGATLLHERFFGPAWALFVVCAAPRTRAGSDEALPAGPTMLSKVAVGALPVAILLVAWPQFEDASRSGRDLDALLGEIPRGSSVTQCVLDHAALKIRVYSATVGPARSLAVVGGRAGLNNLTSPISAVQIKPEYRWDEYDFRTLMHGSGALIPSVDLVKFGWVIGQSRDALMRRHLKEALAPDATLIDERGEWMLFQSKHEVVSPLSQDRPPPPDAEDVLARVNAIRQREFEAYRAAGGRAPPPPPLAP